MIRHASRGRWKKVALLLVIAAAAMLADRMGVFGRGPQDDLVKYDGQEFHVIKVVDGDTVDIDFSDHPRENTRIRLWGVDTPETVKENTPVQHYGPEASAFTRKNILYQRVRLKLEPGNTRDRYGRLLAYIYLPDGRMMNRMLVEQGYAYADPRYDHPFRKEFLQLEAAARREKRGLWKDVPPSELPYYKK